MSQSMFAASPHAEFDTSTPTVVDDKDAVQTLLDSLDDADCRCILEATDGEPLTANEVSESCGLALSTTYRKLDALTGAGLLAKGLRIRSSGKHATEYERVVDDVTVSVSATGLELRVSRREPTERYHTDG